MSEPTQDERRLAMSSLLARLTQAQWITGSYVNEKHVKVEFSTKGIVFAAELKDLLLAVGCPCSRAEAEALEQILNLHSSGSQPPG